MCAGRVAASRYRFFARDKETTGHSMVMYAPCATNNDIREQKSHHDSQEMGDNIVIDHDLCDAKSGV